MRIATFGAAIALLMSSVGTQAEEIVDVSYVIAALQRGAIVLDLRGGADYGRGHIPGAVNLGKAASLLRNPNTEDYLDIEVVGNVTKSLNWCCN